MNYKSFVAKGSDVMRRSVSRFQLSLGRGALLFLVSLAACGQPEPPGNESAGLPNELSGVWVPLSRSVVAFGNLTIEQRTMTWEKCMNEPYRVLRTQGSAWLIEFVGSPPCPLRWGTPFWLEVEGANLITSWCADPDEIKKPLLERSCSSGRLGKRID